MRDFRVASGEVELAVRERGEGPAVVLLHGFPDTSAIWDPIAALLEPRFQVITYDVRGAGASTMPAAPTGYRLELLVQDLINVIDAAGITEPVHLVGHDWGALQGWAAVTRHPERFASFTSCSGVSLDHLRAVQNDLMRHGARGVATLAGQAARSAYIGLFQIPVLPELALKALAKTDSALSQETLDRDIESGLNLYRVNKTPSVSAPKIDIPVQIVIATRDPYLGPDVAAAHARQCEQAWVRRVAAGHWTPRTRPGLLARWIAEVIDAPKPLQARDTGVFEDRLVVVTGAGSGIGKATAEAFASEGARVVIADIDEGSAKHAADQIAAAGGDAHSHQVDVGDAEAMEAFARLVRDSYGVPDVVVNNAGVGLGGDLLDTGEDDWRRIMSINLDGVYRGSRLFGLQMREQGDGGQIINVSSMAAFLPSAFTGPYTATKAAVLRLSECLRAELAPDDIGVSVICPGLISTRIVQNARMVGVVPDGTREGVERFFAQRGKPPELVAKAIVRAARRNPAVVTVAPEAHLGLVLSRLSPGAVRALAGVTRRLRQGQ